MRTPLTLSVLACLMLPGFALADDMSKMTMGGTGSPSDRAFTESMKTMMNTMDVKPTGHPDKDFVSMMIPHHQGAIDMARVEIKYGKDPLLLKLANEIVAAQEKEIADMKAWQAGHGK